MTDQESGAVARRTPEEAFALLGDDTRVAILLALADDDGPVAFSDLRDRVGVRDSGQFNYHLRKLADHFVRKTESGYELTLAGDRIVGALHAGTYTADVAFDPIEIEGICPNCGGSPLVADYEDEHVTVRCPGCESWHNSFTFPPGTVDQFDREELPAAFDRWLYSTFQRMDAGFCANCGGRMPGRLRRTGDDGDRPESAFVEWRCEQCGDWARASPGLPLYYHPASVSFLYDHGIDVTTTPTWEVAARQDDQRAEIVSGEPLRVEVSFTMDGETLVATVDENADVAAVERRDATGR